MPLRAFRRSRSGEELIQIIIRLGLLAVLIVWCLVLVRPFIGVLAWSVVLAAALYPLHTWLSVHLGQRPRFSACVVTLLAAAIVIVPATWLGAGLVEGLRAISEQLGSGRPLVPSPPTVIKDWPLVGERLYDLWNQASTNLEAVLTQVAPHLKPLLRSTLAMVGSMGIGAPKFVVAVILAGFLLPSGPRLVEASKSIMARLLPERSEDFVALAGKTIRSVSQASLASRWCRPSCSEIGLKFAGLANAGLLAFVVMILSILQVGAAIVLVPCIVWIWMTKDIAPALLITVYLVLVGLMDNVLKPFLMGRALTTPMPVLFIGLFGGTLAHGIVGLFIGPIVLAVGWELMTAWIRREQVNDAIAAPDRVPAE
jgi:predicted PurR-regulated permease PerM